MKEMNCREQIFWLWTKRASAQKLLYKFLQQNSTNSHNQLKCKYLNHSDLQDLCYVSEQWNEVAEYSHHWSLYILWIRKWIILRSSHFSEFSVKKWEEIDFLNTNSDSFIINNEIWFLDKWKKTWLLDDSDVTLLDLINTNFVTWNHLNIQKLKMSWVMRNFDE